MTQVNNSAQVPPQRSRLYYSTLQFSHRLNAFQQRIRAGEDPWTNGLRILGYHRVTNNPARLAVTTNSFRCQMTRLLDIGAIPVSLEKGVSILKAGATTRHVCITFDDGYHDFLANAIPVLQELNIPASVAVSTSIVSNGGAGMYWFEKPPRVLNWKDLESVVENPLFGIDGHTRTHPALPAISAEAAWDEISGCKLEIEQRLNYSPFGFTYPAGLYGERDSEMVLKAGYGAGITGNPGINRQDQPAAVLNRMLIDANDNLALFEAKVRGLLERPWSLPGFLKKLNFKH